MKNNPLPAEQPADRHQPVGRKFLLSAIESHAGLVPISVSNGGRYAAADCFSGSSTASGVENRAR